LPGLVAFVHAFDLMSIPEEVDQKLKEAMRARDTETLNVLRMLKAAFKNLAIEKGGANVALDDAEATAVIRKQIKQREDSIAGFEKGGRPEMADKERAEIKVLESFLPAALSEAEVETLAKAAIEEVGATSRAQMGAVMKILQEKVAGRADGRTLSSTVQRLLAG